ncbi:hypothetical protein V8E53_004564, partial [Lactarius tabidus]
MGGIAKELRDVLKIFKDTTLFFSCGTPNLATVIPAMDHIDKVLATMSNSHCFSLSICATLIVGKNAINWYYNKTDHSETYPIALSYFKAQDREDSWVDAAHNIVREEYECLYASACLNGDRDNSYIAVGLVDNS